MVSIFIFEIAHYFKINAHHILQELSFIIMADTSISLNKWYREPDTWFCFFLVNLLISNWVVNIISASMK